MSTRDGRYLKRRKSARKAGKRAENYEETVKKPRRNSEIEQKGKNQQQSTRQKQRKNTTKTAQNASKHGVNEAKTQ